ncbi:uncharacterized protein LOC125047706 isoform X2 [Penaeus chinensis]|nr:uncharacterized protein LOC125047706 isoform X2 [Penaeus chinensis]XP_047502041.1 uncharacterized protein LOC125047706 isoform X2 [Penaeus chinensis]
MEGTRGRTSIWSVGLLETSTKLLLMICLTSTATASETDSQQQNPRMVINSVKAGAHDVSLFLTTYNVTSTQVTISLRKTDTSNKTIIEIFQIPTTNENLSQPQPEHSFVYHAQHTISMLKPDNEYKVCLSAGDLQHEGTPLIYEGCYRVMTLPAVDNTTGIYAALIAMVILLLTAAFIWGIYHLFLHKFLSDIFSGKIRISTPRQESQFNGVLQESQDIENA